MRALTLALVLAGCAGTPAPPGDARPSLELGTGRSSFVPIPPGGGELELVMGPQGGYHVDVAIRIAGLDPDRLELVYEVLRPGATAPLSRTPFLLSASRFRAEGGQLVRTGDFTVLDIAGPDDVVGDEVIVRATARARDGTTASDERAVTLVDAL